MSNANQTQADVSNITSHTSEIDVSNVFIHRLFGTGYEKVLGRSPSETAELQEAIQVAGSILPTMFGVINSFALVATALAILYVISIGVMQTAHEGETLGKRYSTLWTPVRSAFGVMMVAPAPFLGGFSVLQAIILGMVVLSIGGANMLWKTTVTYFTEHKTVFPNPPMQQPSMQELGMILNYEVCLAHQTDAISKTWRGANLLRDQKAHSNYLADDGGMGVVMGSSYSADRITKALPNRDIINADNKIIWSLKENDAACGQVTYKCDNLVGVGDNARKYCERQFQTMYSQISPMLKEQIAERLVNEHLNGGDPVATFSTPDASGNTPIFLAINAAQQMQANTYQDYFTGSTNDSGESSLTEYQEQMLEEWSNRAISEGWIVAGQWHWLINRVSYDNVHSVNVAPEFSSTRNFSGSSKGLLEKSELSELYEKTQSLLEQQELVIYNTDGTPSNIRMSPLSDKDTALAVVDKIVGPSFHNLFNILKGNGDPIAQLAYFGHLTINTSSAVIGTAALMKSTADGIGNSALGLVGGGILSSVAGTAFMIIIALVGPLLLMGGFLAYYLPAIPFIFWMFGIIGWMIMICESLIAAPLWGAAHAIPEGEGMAGQHAKQGYQMFLNVLFRPILLLIGLIMSMQVMYFVSWLAIKGFNVVAEGLISNSFGISGYFAFVFANIMIVTLIISLAHKAHEMIYETADNVMRWIGFGTRPLGEAQGEAATHRAYGAAAIYSNQAAGAAVAKGGDPDPSGGGIKGSASNPSANPQANGGGVAAGGSEAKGAGNPTRGV